MAMPSPRRVGLLDASTVTRLAFRKEDAAVPDGRTRAGDARAARTRGHARRPWPRYVDGSCTARTSRRPTRSRRRSAGAMPLLAGRAAHGRRGRGPQPAPPGHPRGPRPAARAGGRAARRAAGPDAGRCGSTTPSSCPALGLLDESARRRRTPRSARARGHHRRLPRGRPARLGADAAPRGPRRLRPGQRALRGDPRLRDDPQPARGPRARSSTSWSGRPSPGCPGTGPAGAGDRAARRGRRGAGRGARPRIPTRSAGAARVGGRTPRLDAGCPMTDATLSTVRNAARLLKAFLTREESIGVSELARRLGLGKSNVHRLLTTLVAEGLVEQDARTGGYRLGIVVVRARRGRARCTWTCTPPPGRCSPICASRPGSPRRSGCSTGTRWSTSTASRARTRCGCSPRPDAGMPAHCTSSRQGAARAPPGARARARSSPGGR